MAVQASASPGAPTTTTTPTFVREELDGERGQCLAGKPGLLSLSVQGGVRGLSYLAREKQQQQLVQRKRREMKTDGGGGYKEEEREGESIQMFMF